MITPAKLMFKIEEERRRDFEKMLDEGLFADARLVCFDEMKKKSERDGNGGVGGETEVEQRKRRVEIPVHRAILAARSQFFFDTFANGGVDVVVEMDEHFSADVIRSMLSHVYTGEKFPAYYCAVDPHLKLVFKASKRYGLHITQGAIDKSPGFAVLLEEQGRRFSDARIVCYENIDDDGGEGGNAGNGVMKKAVTIPVHKCVLAARSKFFATAFSIGMREAETGEFEVPPESGFSAGTIRTMLEFIYTATLPPSDQSAVMALFKAAHFYQIETLETQCVALLELCPDNWRDLLLTGAKYNCKELMKRALDFVFYSEHKIRTTCLRSDEWRQLMESPEFLVEAPGCSNNNRVQLKTLCGYWMGDVPVTPENCCEVLRLGAAYENRLMKWIALGCIRKNLAAMKKATAAEGWRQLMESVEKEGELYWANQPYFDPFHHERIHFGKGLLRPKWHRPNTH